MNGKKKAVKRKTGVMIELFRLCTEINSLEERKKELTGELPTVFFSYSGHVSLLSIQIHSKGWGKGSFPDIEFNLYFNGKCYDAGKIKECRNELIKIRDSIGRNR